MHEHLYYTTGPGVYGQLGVSFSRLYLAGGVTTMRTAGQRQRDHGHQHRAADRSRRDCQVRDRRDGAVCQRSEHVPADAHRRERGAGAHARGLLGGSGRDVTQGVHADFARVAEGRDRRRASPRDEDHRALVFGHLRRGRRSRDRQPRARLLRRHRLRPRQAAGRLPGPGTRPADHRRARRKRRAVQGAGEEAGRQARRR